ncbi:hypothetical protein ElyMa_005263600 [Elysia marginata]|uniref:Sfi1 spindle body domain-containing protein n=1 Tax=Elysia marginata TaxID=1093978 RepID=A0AAV4K3E8_9GAST|nr:hypothetical protein ElyMa_005263600 [Elysia marginata]
MNHRRSASVVAAAASKASWDTVEASKYHHDDGDKGIISVQDASPKAGIFKQRKAIGRHTELRKNSTEQRGTGQNDVNSKEKTAIGKKTGRGPPSLLDRPRTSTGFEDYFDDISVPAKLRSLKGKPNLQELKRLTLWDRDLKNLPISPRERRCVSSLEKTDSESKFNKTDLGDKLDEGRERKPSRKASERSHYHSSYKNNEDDHDEKDNNKSDLTDKIKAFQALVSTGVKSRTDGPTQRDISNEQLKRAKSLSSVVEEVGGYVKFKSVSSETAGLRSSTPVNIEHSYEEESVNQYFGNLNFKSYLKTKPLFNRSKVESAEVNGYECGQRNDLPLRFKDGDNSRFRDDRVEDGPVSNQFLNDKGNEIENGLSKEEFLRLSERNISRSDSPTNNHRESKDILYDRSALRITAEIGQGLQSRHGDVKKIIRRSPNTKRVRERGDNKASDEASGQLKQSYPPDLAKVDKEVLQYMLEAKERRRRRDNIMSLVQGKAHSSHSPDAKTKQFDIIEQRSASSLDIHLKPRDGVTAHREPLTRPFSAAGIPDRSSCARDSQLGMTVSSNVRSSETRKSNLLPKSQNNETALRHGAKQRQGDDVPGKGASLRSHLNALGASLSSLSSRLTSSSESDLKAHTEARSDGVHDTVTLTAHSVRGEADVSGAERSAVILSRESPTSAPRRQSRGGIITSPFDVAHVRISIREDGLNLQTWASSSSLVSEPNPESHRIDTHAQHRVGDYAWTAVKADHSIVSDTPSSEIGSPYDGRQTNVKVVLGEGSLTPRSESSHASLPRRIRQYDTQPLNHYEDTKLIRQKKTASPKLLEETHNRKIRRKHTGDNSMEHFLSNSPQSAKISDSFDSTGQTVSDSENSEYSLDDTIVSDGATYNREDPDIKRMRSIQKAPNDVSKTSESKPIRPKVISRKTPLKAVHPAAIDTADVKDNVISTIRISKKLQKSQDDANEHKQKQILVRRPTEDRADQMPRIANAEGSDACTISKSSVEMLKASMRSLASSRSKSSLGLFSSTSSLSSALNSPLPSKTNMKQITERTRPKTSLAIPTTPASSKKKTQKTSKPKTLVSETEHSSPTKSALLKEKVQKLHEDITRRLQSRANSSYCIVSDYDNKEATGKVRVKSRGSGEVDDDSDQSDSCLSEASTIQKVDSPDGDTRTYSPQSLPRQGGTGLQSNISSPLSSPKPGFVTSTPVKNVSSARNKESSELDTEAKRRLLRKVARELSKEKMKGDVEKETDTAQRYSYGRYTPDPADDISSQHRLLKYRQTLKARSRETDSFSDDDDDDIKHAQDGRTHFGLRRSESVGSLVRSKVHDKTDFMDRILDKMAGLPIGQQRIIASETPGPARLSAASRPTRIMSPDINNRMSGRESPADLLLDHLDNPQMVKLLQRLYRADPDTRKILMVKFQYFKAWVGYAKEEKEKRVRKEALVAKGESHLRYRLLCLYFVTWWRRASHCAHVRRADALLRRHTLTKGLKALSWSLSQSRHIAARVQANVRTTLINRAFGKWKTGAVRHRQERKQEALNRWKQFVTETKKVRHMRDLIEFNLQQEVIRCWHKRYRKRIKLNMAFQFFRHKLGEKALGLWKLYVSQCKLAQEKLTVAVAKHQKTLLTNAFYSMLLSYKKIKKAKAHFRSYKLTETLWAWREATQVCRTERLRDMAASTEHWRCARLRQGFSQWREALQVRRLHRLSEAHMYR